MSETRSHASAKLRYVRICAIALLPFLSACLDEDVLGPSERSTAVGAGAAGVGNALQFDGLDDWIDLNPAPIGTPASLTVEHWVRLDELGKIHFLVSDALNDFNDGFTLWVAASNVVVFTLAANSALKANAISGTTLELDRWYHVAGAYNADDGMLKVFINGVEEGSVSYTGGIMYADGRDLRFATQIKTRSRAARLLKGAMDEVRIWDFAKDASQIAADMNHEIDASASGLIGYWQMNEGTGTTTADLSGNGNEGELMLGPIWILAYWGENQETTGREVAIDIKPHNDRNKVKPGRGKIHVAVLGAADFNPAEELDWYSLTFGRIGDEASLDHKDDGRPHCKARDVNKDEFRDLVCKFDGRRAAFEYGDTEGYLEGVTVDGDLIFGEDDIYIKEKHGGDHGDG